ncbi:hypothetical protein CDD82_3172 [Ophiocordyceps australis]|uniref:Mitochondrial inner membrane protein OXA1 n=1 Tax=Ophiocordyceps australis TaxID=1399860 RepID=A0A2C5ZAY0_9HYPO|nr:hypothetical protein CDD82_3172 [Ophiocordyceps australis]
MLPSRGLTSSLPSSAARLRLQRIPRRNLSSLSTTLPRNGRQTTSALGALGSGGASGSTVASLLSSTRHSRRAGPLLGLGAASSARSFSLWPFGKSNGGNVSAPTTNQAPSSAAPEPAMPVEPVAHLDTQAANAATMSPPGTEAGVSASGLDFNTLNEAIYGIGAEEILNMPENLGYLHAIGLDYGFGPTAIMQWILEHVHVMTGFGWGTSIIISAFIIRILAFYPQLRAAQVGEKTKLVTKDPRYVDAITMAREHTDQTVDPETKVRNRFVQEKLREEYGVKSTDIFWGLIPVPLSFGLFRIVNGMVNVPVPSLETAGFLWFSDLTACDPYYLLPILNVVCAAGSIYINPAGTEQISKLMKPTTMASIGCLVLVLTSFLSNGVNLMGIALGSSNLITLLILRMPLVRQKAGLSPITDDTSETEPPLSLPTTSPTTRPPQPPTPEYQPPRAPLSFRERLTKELGDAKKGISESVSNLTGSLYTSAQDEDKAETKRKANLRRIEELRHLRAVEDFERKHKRKK